MPPKPKWWKKAIGWSRVALFATDTFSDGYVGYDLINRCHYKYAIGVFTFFWLPGLLSGGTVATIAGAALIDTICGYKLSKCQFFSHFTKLRYKYTIFKVKQDLKKSMTTSLKALSRLIKDFFQGNFS